MERELATDKVDPPIGTKVSSLKWKLGQGREQNDPLTPLLKAVDATRSLASGRAEASIRRIELSGITDPADWPGMKASLRNAYHHDSLAKIQSDLFGDGIYAKVKRQRDVLFVEVLSPPTVTEVKVVGDHGGSYTELASQIKTGVPYTRDFINNAILSIYYFCAEHDTEYYVAVGSSKFDVNESNGIGVEFEILHYPLDICEPYRSELDAQLKAPDKSLRPEVEEFLARQKRQSDSDFEKIEFAIVYKYNEFQFVDDTVKNVYNRDVSGEFIRPGRTLIGRFLAGIGVAPQLRPAVYKAIQLAANNPTLSEGEFQEQLAGLPTGRLPGVREEPSRFDTHSGQANWEPAFPTTFEEAKAVNPTLRTWTEMRKTRGDDGRLISVWDHLRNPETGLGMWTSKAPGLPRNLLRKIDPEAGQRVDRLAKEIPPDVHLAGAPKGPKSQVPSLISAGDMGRQAHGAQPAGRPLRRQPIVADGRVFPKTFEEAKAINPNLRLWSEMRETRGADGRRLTIWDHLRDPVTGLGMWTSEAPGLPRNVLRKIDPAAGQRVDYLAREIPDDIHFSKSRPGPAPMDDKGVGEGVITEEIRRKVLRDATRAARATKAQR